MLFESYEARRLTAVMLKEQAEGHPSLRAMKHERLLLIIQMASVVYVLTDDIEILAFVGRRVGFVPEICRGDFQGH